MNRLRHLYRGETATIVGSGPSLLTLTPADFGPGPVIALNFAILEVRKLGLPNPIYTMQKDGCIPHHANARVPLGCACPAPARLVEPILPESVILSAAESSRCFPDYPKRHVIDVQRRFHIHWWSPSVAVAVRVAAFMGCSRVRMLAMDGYTRKDYRRVEPGGLTQQGREYQIAGLLAVHEARRVRLDIEWR